LVHGTENAHRGSAKRSEQVRAKSARIARKPPQNKDFCQLAQRLLSPY
jgi:hypothetical protein